METSKQTKTALNAFDGYKLAGRGEYNVYFVVDGERVCVRTHDLEKIDFLRYFGSQPAGCTTPQDAEQYAQIIDYFYSIAIDAE